MENKTNFINFYNKETKKGIRHHFTVPAGGKVELYQTVRDGRQTLHIVMPSGMKEICVTPRIDVLGKFSTYVKEVGSEVVDTIVG